ncbi:MAG: PQQ-binding-like beta-propeller repeat protein, partial [Planctomycetes bacterium]|nr:PQQ-binding-like beta-propeller repeat protein [Planctomycetota bacterium]
EVISRSGPSEKQAKNSHASSTPIAADGKIYAHFGHMGTACIDVSGEVIWRQMSLVYPPEHGNGSSPILVDDKLIFTGDGFVDPFLAALDKRTGDVVWKVNRTETKAKNKYSFCTPLLIEEGGRKIVVSPYSGAVAAYDPADGKEIWRVLYGQGYSVTPRPVYADGMVFICSGFSKAYVYAIRLGGHGDVTDTHVAWKSASSVPRTPSVLLVGKKIYYVSDKGIVSCIAAASGKEYWQGKIKAPFSASPVLAGGKIYLTSEKGKTFVIKAGEEFEIIAENDLGERTFASPAVSGKSLFIRTKSTLYCIKER